MVDYLTIWIVYWLASLAGLVVVWRVGLLCSNSEFRWVLLLCAMAVLWTPARLESGSEHWVPAFMAALLEAMSDGGDALVRRGLPILMVMVVLLFLSFLWRVLLRKSRFHRSQ